MMLIIFVIVIVIFIFLGLSQKAMLNPMFHFMAVQSAH